MLERNESKGVSIRKTIIDIRLDKTDEFGLIIGFFKKLNLMWSFFSKYLITIYFFNFGVFLKNLKVIIFHLGLL